MKQIRSYLNSNYFILVTYLVVLFCWWFDYALWAMGYCIAMGLVIIATQSNRSSIAVVVMAAILIPRSYEYNGNVILFVITVAILIPFLFIDMFVSKIKIKDEFLLSMFLFLGANLLSFINATDITRHVIWIGVGQMGAFALVTLYFTNQHKQDEIMVICKSAFAMGLTIFLQCALYIITYEGSIIGKDIDIKWAISNGIAMTSLILIPLQGYLYIRYPQHKYILLGIVLQILVIIFSLSKGAYLTLAIISIPMGLILFLKAHNKWHFVLDVVLMITVTGLIVYGLSSFDKIAMGIEDYFATMDTRGWFNDEARLEIYRTGLEVFKTYPLFGSGSYTSSIDLGTLMRYHNYGIQTLATTGIVGGLAFVYYLFAMIKRGLVNHSYNWMVLITIIAMMIHGLVDNSFYNPVVMILFAIIVPYTLKRNELDQANA